MGKPPVHRVFVALWLERKEPSPSSRVPEFPVEIHVFHINNSCLQVAPEGASILIYNLLVFNIFKSHRQLENSYQYYINRNITALKLNQVYIIIINQSFKRDEWIKKLMSILIIKIQILIIS